MEINFVKHKKLFFSLSGILVLASIIALILFGLRWGIDFVGGSIIEVDYKDINPNVQEIRSDLSRLDLQEFSVQPKGDKGIILRTQAISEEMHQKILDILKQKGDLEEARFELVGPIVGEEVRKKTVIVLILALLSIMFYVTFAFRKVSYPVSSWQYGVATLIALFHDVLIPIGVFALLGKFYGVEITVPIVTALLTVFGYSVNDTVVIFDRIRENLIRTNLPFQDVINKSLNETLSRSLSTSLTTLFVLFALFFLGSSALKYFSLALILGITLGTYSSICLASLLLLSWVKKS
ncbi:protein translocase subunit SecF [bacterium]|nr:protein translocase subunit SecF [bacterium]